VLIDAHNDTFQSVMFVLDLPTLAKLFYPQDKPILSALVTWLMPAN